MRDFQCPDTGTKKWDEDRDAKGRRSEVESWRDFRDTMESPEATDVGADMPALAMNKNAACAAAMPQATWYRLRRLQMGTLPPYAAAAWPDGRDARGVRPVYRLRSEAGRLVIS